MIRIAVEGDRSHTTLSGFIGAMENLSEIELMSRRMQTDFTEVTAEVNGQHIEFDIYESRDFLNEFRMFKCDGYIMLADPAHFEAAQFTENIAHILKFEQKTIAEIPMTLVAVGDEKKTKALSKFAEDNHISFAHISSYKKKDKVHRIFVDMLARVLPNLGTDRLTTRPPMEKTPHPIMMRPKPRGPEMPLGPGDQKKKNWHQD